MIKKAFFIATTIIVNLTMAPAQTAAPKKSEPAKPSAPAPAGNAATAVTLLPTVPQVEAALKRTLGYDPGISWDILDIRSSAMAGVADVTLSINKQAPQHIYLSSDSQHAIIGEMIPFGENPFASAREKLQAADGPARGPNQPSIVIVEFSDLECPHCKAAQPILEKLAADFPNVRFVFQQFPLPASIHPWAMKAALYADCAAHTNSDAFWKYVDSVFENQGGIALATADDKLKELATAAGLDAQKISACAAAPETETRVKKSLALGQGLNVISTPTVFINGRMILALANIPYDQLKNLVQFEIDHAGR